MNQLCQKVWEFEHPSGCKVRVIENVIGIELFQSDVLQILFPELREESREAIIVNNANKSKCCLNGQIVEVPTVDAMAVHALGQSKAKEVRRLMQWVRKNILPYFKKDLDDVAYYYSRYNFFQIDYNQRESLIAYLRNQEKKWQDKYIDLYLQFINKRIPLSTRCPHPSDFSDKLLRDEYYKLGNTVIEPSKSYEELYERLVLIPGNLLKAQELDLLVLNLLKKMKCENSTEVIKQGLFLQTLHSVAINITSFGNIKELTPFYLELIECFSNEMVKD
ncbi:MAG: hypothetical protein VKN72_29180 [Nostocales cyanobacterium 94392]|nr:hypothetical protein [Nostocales cyanobacterium 94392]